MSMFHHRQYRHALACLAFVSAVGHAGEYTLDPITVTASRYERPLATTPAAVTVIEAADLAAYRAQPLEEILAARGGVTLVRSGGPGQQTSVFLRGSNSNSVLVLVDGMKINGATFGGANLQDLRGADIERIEIVRGPRSTLYGSEAIGGVISITTRRTSATAGTATASDSAYLAATRGSDNLHDLRAGATHDIGDFHFAAGIGDFRTDGDPVTDRTDIAGAHHNVSGSLGVSNRHNDTRYGIDGQAARGTTRYVDCIYVSYVCVGIKPLDQQFHNETLNAWSATEFGDALTLRTRLGHAADEIDQLDLRDFARTRRISGSVEIEHRHRTGQRDNVLVAGVDGEREEVDALVYGSPLAGDTDIDALFARDELTLGRHQFSLGVRGTEYDSFGGHTTTEASYGLRASEDIYAWLSAGRGFRAPDFTERFGSSGNPDLQPEKSASAELGLRWRHAAQEFTATGFVQRIDDLIDYPAPAYTATNIARARNTGSELGWSWHDAATRIDAQILLQDPVDDRSGERLSRRPEKQFSATARRTFGNVELRASALAMDRRDNSAFDNIELPGCAVFDLGAAWKLQPDLTLDARIDNVGDREYALASGAAGDYRMPDRAFFLGVEWRPSKTWSP